MGHALLKTPRGEELVVLPLAEALSVELDDIA